jgi:hypothetical protein
MLQLSFLSIKKKVILAHNIDFFSILTKVFFICINMNSFIICNGWQ